MNYNEDFKFLVINTKDLWDKYENKDQSKNVEIDHEGICLKSTTTYVYENEGICLLESSTSN